MGGETGQCVDFLRLHGMLVINSLPVSSNFILFALSVKMDLSPLYNFLCQLAVKLFEWRVRGKHCRTEFCLLVAMLLLSWILNLGGFSSIRLLQSGQPAAPSDHQLPAPCTSGDWAVKCFHETLPCQQLSPHSRRCILPASSTIMIPK